MGKVADDEFSDVTVSRITSDDGWAAPATVQGVEDFGIQNPGALIYASLP